MTDGRLHPKPLWKGSRRRLHYWLKVDGDRTVPAVTYADWGEFTAPAGRRRGSAADARARVGRRLRAGVSGQPGGVPAPAARSHDRDAFSARNIEELPADGRLWYTDGSSISSEPLGRVLTIANALDERREPDAPRVALLVNPLSEIPEDPASWTADAAAPTWLQGLARTLEIMPEQVLHDDLRRVQHVNARFARVDRFVEAVAPHLDPRRSMRCATRSVTRSTCPTTRPSTTPCGSRRVGSAGSTARCRCTWTSSRRCCWPSGTTAGCPACLPGRPWATSAASCTGGCGAATSRWAMTASLRGSPTGSSGPGCPSIRRHRDRGRAYGPPGSMGAG
jgi:hypothetical protein